MFVQKSKQFQFIFLCQGQGKMTLPGPYLKDLTLQIEKLIHKIILLFKECKCRCKNVNNFDLTWSWFKFLSFRLQYIILAKASWPSWTITRSMWFLFPVVLPEVSSLSPGLNWEAKSTSIVLKPTTQLKLSSNASNSSAQTSTRYLPFFSVLRGRSQTTFTRRGG